MTWKSVGDELKANGVIREMQQRMLSRKPGDDQDPESRFTNQGNSRFECAVCKDELGWLAKRPVQIKHGVFYDMDHWVDCDCAERRMIGKLFAFSEITPQMQARGFSTFRLKDRPECVAGAFETAKEYLTSFESRKTQLENSIFLGGRPGSGKTHLLLAIANALIKRGETVLYFPFVEGLDEMRSEIRENGTGYQKKLERLQRVPVLFIDDLYKAKKGEEPTKYEIKFLFSVVNYRYLNHLPMLISSELTVDQVLIWDEAVGSRIFQMCRDSLVHLTDGPGLNYRLPKDYS